MENHNGPGTEIHFSLVVGTPAGVAIVCDEQRRGCALRLSCRPLLLRFRRGNPLGAPPSRLPLM